MSRTPNEAGENGVRIEPAQTYRVTVNSYLAIGGDGFTVLGDGGAKQFGVHDDEALFGYFHANSPLKPPPLDRIARIN